MELVQPVERAFDSIAIFVSFEVASDWLLAVHLEMTGKIPCIESDERTFSPSFSFRTSFLDELIDELSGVGAAVIEASPVDISKQGIRGGGDFDLKSAAASNFSFSASSFASGTGFLSHRSSAAD